MGAENRLIVEGVEDKWVLINVLKKAGIQWDTEEGHLAEVHPLEGFENLTRREISNQLKTSGLRRLGLIVDIDSDATSRWESIRNVLSSWFPLPATPSADGIVVPATETTPRFGVWLMPDNVSRGMLETFLLALRPDADPKLLAHAEAATNEAANLGAPFAAVHRDKALIHTWLSWQEPPGSQLHVALQRRMLDPNRPYAAPFVSWFRNLFELGEAS